MPWCPRSWSPRTRVHAPPSSLNRKKTRGSEQEDETVIASTWRRSSVCPFLKKMAVDCVCLFMKKDLVGPFAIGTLLREDVLLICRRAGEPSRSGERPRCTGDQGTERYQWESVERVQGRMSYPLLVWTRTRTCRRRDRICWWCCAANSDALPRPPSWVQFHHLIGHKAATSALRELIAQFENKTSLPEGMRCSESRCESCRRFAVAQICCNPKVLICWCFVGRQ